MAERSDEASGLIMSAAVERYGTSSETPPEPQPWVYLPPDSSDDSSSQLYATHWGRMHVAESMHAEEMVHNMFESLEAVRIAAPGPLFCNQCCLQRQQQWLVHRVEPFHTTPSRPIDPPYAPVGWFAEESNFLARCTSFFFPGWRPLTYTLFAGAPPASSSELLSHTPLDGSRVVLTHQKGVSCGATMFTLMAVFTSIPAHWLTISLLWHLVPVRFPLCCCQPYISTTDNAGKELGRSQFLPDWNLCVPTVQTACWMQTPFHLYHADSGQRVACERGEAQVADMRDMQEVFKVGGCGHQRLYHTKFPRDATAAMKATLTGATLLVDLTTFEQDTTTIG